MTDFNRGFVKRSHNIIADDLFDVLNPDSPDFGTNSRWFLTRAMVNWIDEEIECSNIPTASEVSALMEFVELADWFAAV